MNGPIKHRSVEDLMTETVVTVAPAASFKDMATLLRRHRVSALPVVDHENKVLGIVSEADLLLKEERGSLVERHLVETSRRRSERRKAEGLTAADLMSAPAITVSPAASAATAAALMHSRGVKRLPVVDEASRLVGIVSRSDLLKIFLRHDADIQQEVRGDLVVGTLWLEPEAIEISVADGVVTFSGDVPRLSDGQILARLTLGLDGVVGVVNRLAHRVDDSRPAPVVEALPGMFSSLGVRRFFD